MTEKDTQAAPDAPLGAEKGGSIDMEGFVRHAAYWDPKDIQSCIQEGTPTTWREAAFKNCAVYHYKEVQRLKDAYQMERGFRLELEEELLEEKDMRLEAEERLAAAATTPPPNTARAVLLTQAERRARVNAYILGADGRLDEVKQTGLHVAVRRNGPVTCTWMTGKGRVCGRYYDITPNRCGCQYHEDYNPALEALRFLREGEPEDA